jgi:hypothetical protein
MWASARSPLQNTAATHTVPLPPSNAAAHEGRDRLRGVLESGTVRVFLISRIEQRGKADHQVNSGSEGGKCLEGGEASRVLGVEKPAEEEPSGQRFLQWVVRHSSQPYGGSVSPVEITGGYALAIAPR